MGKYVTEGVAAKMCTMDIVNCSELGYLVFIRMVFEYDIVAET